MLRSTTEHVVHKQTCTQSHMNIDSYKSAIFPGPRDPLTPCLALVQWRLSVHDTLEHQFFRMCQDSSVCVSVCMCISHCLRQRVFHWVL